MKMLLSLLTVCMTVLCGLADDVYGPFGRDSDIVEDVRQLAPTVYDVALTIKGKAAQVGDCIAAYRQSDNALCGLGMAYDAGSGEVKCDLVLYSYKDAKIHFKAWQSSTAATAANILDVDTSCDITAPTPGTTDMSKLTLYVPSQTFTVTFSANGGTGTMAQQKVQEGVATKLNKCAYVKEDCAFAGWKGSDGNSYADAAEIKMYANLTLTAQWEIVPRIAVSPSWKEHGWHVGTGSFEVFCNVGWTASADKDWIVLETTEGSGNGTVSYSVKENTNEERRDGTITVTTADGTKKSEFSVAQRPWSKGYVVTFLSGNSEASGVMEPQEFEDGVEQRLSWNMFSRTGYVFVAWEDQNGVRYSNGEFITPTSTLTLTAIWSNQATVYGYAENEQAKAKGTVTKSPKNGVVKVGDSVTLTAKAANKNTVFAYWVDEDWEIVSSDDGTRTGYAATLKVKPDAVESEYSAVFRLASACKRPVFDSEYPYGEGYESQNSMVGVAYKAQIVVNEDAYPVKFSATGLPKGLKINATTGVISGVPTKAGSYKPVITVKSAANAKLKASSVKLPIKIAALPSWARGTFNGRTYAGGDEAGNVALDGSARITVGTTGKISGTLAFGGTNWTVSVSSYSVESYSADGDFVASGTASAVVGKKTYKMPWRWTFSKGYGSPWDTTGDGTLGTKDEYGDYPATWTVTRNFWSDSGAKEFIVGDGYDPYADWTGGYVWRTPAGESISLTVAASGVVKAAGTLSSGRKLSISTTMLYGYGNSAVLYAAPQTVVTKNKKGKIISSVSYPSFFAEVEFSNEPGTPVAGEYIAYRKQGVRAAMGEDSTGTGTFKYSSAYGQAASNATVTVTAVPAKKSVFAYWMLDGDIVGYGTSYKVKMSSGDFTGLVAVFRKASDFKTKPATPFIGDGDFDTLRVGVPFRSVIEIDPESRPVKFTAKNLPAGLSLNATTGVISGVPTASGSKTIQVTATSVANAKLVSAALKIPVKVSGLHSWAKGTFTGSGTLGGKKASVTMTVGSTGKISGKFTVAKKAYSFSAKSFREYDGCYFASTSLTYGKTVYPVEILVDVDADGKGFSLVDVMYVDDREGQFGDAEVFRK